MDNLSLFFSWILGMCTLAVVQTIRLASVRQRAFLVMQKAETERQKITHEHALKLQQEQQASTLRIQQELFTLQEQKNEYKVQHNKLIDLSDRLKKEEQHLSTWKKLLTEQAADINTKQQHIDQLLHNISSLSKQEAEEKVLEATRKQMERTIYELQKNQLATFEDEWRSKLSSTILSSIERREYWPTKESFSIDIPLEIHHIPKIIGKEGRNILTLETLLHVNLSIENATIRISSFNPQRRYVATHIIKELIRRDKITPTIIQTVFNEAPSIESFCLQLGKQACDRLSLTDYFSHDVLQQLGQLHFRSSFGQNVLAHSIEVALFMGSIAAELNLNEQEARIMGLFHDIGKGLPCDHQSHALAGKTFAEEHHFPLKVIHGIAAHHGEEPISSKEAHLLILCDTLSAQLPGNRHAHDNRVAEQLAQCEQTLSTIPGILSSWGHYGEKRFDIVLRIEPGQEIAPIVERAQRLCDAIADKPVVLSVL